MDRVKTHQTFLVQRHQLFLANKVITLEVVFRDQIRTHQVSQTQQHSSSVVNNRQVAALELLEHKVPNHKVMLLKLSQQKLKLTSNLLKLAKLVKVL